MNFFKKRIKDEYLENTSVENMFLIDYMPDAEGDFVKVYLAGLLSSGNSDASNRKIAMHLNMDEERVLQAWNYWEKRGVIRKHYPDPNDRFHYEVEFVSLKERLYSPDYEKQVGGEGDGIPEMNDDALKSLYAEVQQATGRMLESKELDALLSWRVDDRLPADFIIFVYKFCAEKRNNTQYRYVASVLHGWVSEGIRTVKDAEKFLEENDLRVQRRRRVMQALGFPRLPSERESEIIDSWFEELGATMDKVLDACGTTSGISNPNVNYVNTVIRNWHGKERGKSGSGKSGGPADEKQKYRLVQQVYDEARKRHQNEKDKHIREVYDRIPEMKELEASIRHAGIGAARASMQSSAATSEKKAALKEKLEKLILEKNRLLEQAGFPQDYMEMHYDCPVCEDTGITKEGARCRCYLEKSRSLFGTE